MSREEQKILRYGQLSLKKSLSEEEKTEMEKIRKELGMEHKRIIERAKAITLRKY